jgi:hypothetical protein
LDADHPPSGSFFHAETQFDPDLTWARIEQ